MQAISNNFAVLMGSVATYPPATPPQTSEYDNLPPESDPVVNTLEVNKQYKIVITATLKEYINNNWINAQKSDGSTVQQIVTKNFRTGPMPPPVSLSSHATRN
jgi:hypothetical protein